MADRAHTRSVLLLLAAALCWSLGGLLIKSVPWPPLAVAGGRGFMAAVFLLLAGGRSVRFTGSATQLGAAVAYASTTMLFVCANKLTTAANAILLQYTAPVYVALLGAWFLGERTRPSDWATIAAVLIGLAFFLGDSGLRLEGLAGMAVALGSGVSFGVLIVLLRKQRDASPLAAIILGNLISGLCGLPWLIGAPALAPAGWAALLVLGVVQLGAAYLFYARAIPHVTALEAVLIPVIEPVLNPLWVLFVLGERPGPLALAGGAVVLGAVTLRAVLSIRRPTPNPA